MATQNREATRFYSNLQESRIAEYLGWRRVAASGARPFDKGDIASDEYAGECKTHKSHDIYAIFYLFDWGKITSEAMSPSRRPVLFTDNGTQKTDKTFCMIDRKFVSSGIRVIEHTEFPECTLMTSRFRIEVAPLIKRLSEHPVAIHFATEHFDLAVMRLCTFKSMINGEYDD